MECVYLIRHNGTGLFKIGMTTNWERRSSQLQVGRGTTKVMTVPCTDSRRWERVLHAMFSHKRLPQSEWFQITEDEAIAKMRWLASQTNQQIIIGDWRQAAAGNYYRRRKSKNGNWYTEQKSEYQLRQEKNAALDRVIAAAEKTQLDKSRKESGYWPAKGDPSRVEWQEKDPTYREGIGMKIMGFIFMGMMIISFGSAAVVLSFVLWPILIPIGIALLVLKLRGELDFEKQVNRKK